MRDFSHLRKKKNSWEDFKKYSDFFSWLLIFDCHLLQFFNPPSAKQYFVPLIYNFTISCLVSHFQFQQFIQQILSSAINDALSCIMWKLFSTAIALTSEETLLHGKQKQNLKPILGHGRAGRDWTKRQPTPEGGWLSISKGTYLHTDLSWALARWVYLHTHLPESEKFMIRR